jgi:glycosyltransferase involved in cell wall biosynthesis
LNPRIRTAVVPAGVDLQYFEPVQDVSEEPFSIVSVAALDWLPNVDSVLWFCDRILPLVRQELPQARMYVVGKNPPASVRALAQRENIVVTGYVEDIRQYVAQGSVVVVPMRMGGGIRVRILQMMAMAKPVVSTSLGAEGIDVTDRQDILLADGEVDFAQATLQLLREPALRGHIGNNAHQLVERRYSWDTVVDLTERVYRRVVQGSGQDGQLDLTAVAGMD